MLSVILSGFGKEIMFVDGLRGGTEGFFLCNWELIYVFLYRELQNWVAMRDK
jgi:hypothetical protein